MVDGLYVVPTLCPVCEETFDVIKVKTTASKLEKADDDFCMHYSGINPLLYEPWICDYCGYAGSGDGFNKLTDQEIDYLKKLCLVKFTDDPQKNPFELSEFHKQLYNYLESKSLTGERDEATAIDAYRILIANQETRKAPKSLIGCTLLRIAWIYRFQNDKMEMIYLEKACQYLVEAVDSENFASGKFDNETCSYLIGELYIRLGKKREGMEWFGRVIKLEKESQNQRMIEKTRQRIYELNSSR